MKKLFKLLFSRLFFGGVFIVLQIAVMVAALHYFRDRYAQVQTAFMALSDCSPCSTSSTRTAPRPSR